MTELRKDNNIPLELNKNSEYKDIIRSERVFPNLMIPKKLENALPFKSKNKNYESKIRNIKNHTTNDEKEFLKKNQLFYNKPLKSLLTGTEKDVYSMLQRLQTIKNLKDKKAKLTKSAFEKEEIKKQEEILKKQKKKNMNKNIKKINKN